MKYIYIILLTFICILMVASCIDDKGNYDYKSIEEIVPFKIKSIVHGEDTITTDLHLTSKQMKLKVDIEGLDPNTTYSYKWFIHTHLVPIKDRLLAEVKDIDIDINIPSGNQYVLYFEVKDNATGIQERREIKRFTIDASLIGKGWYMMKEVDGKTDLDFIAENGLLKLNDILTSHVYPNNSRMNGEPVDIYYYPKGFYIEEYDENGDYIGVEEQPTPVLVLATETELRTYNGQNFKLIYNFKDSFFEVPKTTKMQMAYNTLYNVQVMNDGVVHTLDATIKQVISKYGSHTPSQYKFSDQYLRSVLQNVFFDLNTSSFKVLQDGTQINLVDYPEPDLGSSINISLKDMNADLIKMVARYISGSNNTNRGFAFMKDRSTNQNYVMQMDINLNSLAYPVSAMENIDPNAEVLQAEVLGAARGGSFVYYAKGNQLKAYVLGSLTEKEILIREFENENITFIGSLPQYGRSTAVVIATQSGDSWKTYILDQRGITAPELKDEPYKVTVGETPGVVRNVYHYSH